MYCDFATVILLEPTQYLVSLEDLVNEFSAWNTYIPVQHNFM